MGRMTMYVQCRLEKQTEEGRMYQVAWIPDGFAHIGRKVLLKDHSSWHVVSVGARCRADDAR